MRLGAAVALFLLLVGQAQVTVLDGSSMLAVTRSLVHDGSLAVPAPLGVAGHDGLFYSKYGLLLALLSLPPVLLVQPIGAISATTSAGSYSMSASWMTAISCAISGIAARTAAPLPRLG